MHRCPTCDRRFETRRGLGVHHSSVHDERLPNRTCDRCNSTFYSDYEKKYCSEECLNEAVTYEGSANPNYRGGKTETACVLCGDTFEYYPSEKEGLYCSYCVKNERWRTPPDIDGERNPRWNGGTVTVECTVCAEPIERYPSNVGDVAVCGDDCRSAWLAEAFPGDGHPNWKGGGNGAYGEGWNAVRSAALERDGYACVVCGATKADLDRNPDVHHIAPVRSFVESDDHEKTDAHYLENVVSLCVPCHRKAEFGKISVERLRSAIGVDTPTVTAPTRPDG